MVFTVVCVCCILKGQACVETGEAFRRLSEAKYTLEDNVKQDFLQPLHNLQSTELKEIAVCYTIPNTHVPVPSVILKAHLYSNTR